MRTGSIHHIKSRKNSFQSYVVVYPDLEELLDKRLNQNVWVPTILSQPAGLQAVGQSFKRMPKARNVLETFILLETKVDAYGRTYHHCLYNDSDGWIVDSSNSCLVEEERT